VLHSGTCFTGHPKIKAFMTHGGLLSLQETIYHGVPLVGIPIFGDQDLNIAQAVKSGYATMVEIIDINEEKLEAAIRTVLDNPRYV